MVDDNSVTCIPGTTATAPAPITTEAPAPLTTTPASAQTTAEPGKPLFKLIA